MLVLAGSESVRVFLSMRIEGSFSLMGFCGVVWSSHMRVLKLRAALRSLKVEQPVVLPEVQWRLMHSCKQLATMTSMRAYGCDDKRAPCGK